MLTVRRAFCQHNEEDLLTFQRDPIMDVADKLLDKIFSFVELQGESADKLNNLAKELEEHKMNVNISKTVGSSVSVGGAAAMTAAGIVTICTGGAALPILGLTGAVVSGIGVATSVGSEVANAVLSGYAMEEAEQISKKIQDLEEEIQKLVDLLAEEGKKRQQQVEDYVVEQILRAMAKRSGLVLNDKINLRNMLSALPENPIYGIGTALSLLGVSLTALGLISIFVTKAIAKKYGTTIMSKGLTTLVASGTATAAKAAGRVGGGAVALVFSVPELISDVTNLVQNNCETEASKSLRKTAEALKKASEEMKQDLDRIKKWFEKLARVKRAVENTNRSSYDKKTLIDFVIANCEDDNARQWLRQYLSDAFFHLVDMFLDLIQRVEEENSDSESIDIIFVAHGCISDSMIPARWLLPWSSINDVILYSPWNCAINADVAYGVATGRIKPQHRVFYCRPNQGCGVPDENHWPTHLPNCWNSMRRTGDLNIPNITLSPLEQGDFLGWNSYLILEQQHGQPGRNRVVRPFNLPAGSPSVRVPFFIVTLALSLVLLSSRFKVTVHLTACLSDHSAVNFNQEYLRQQYACCIDNTAMTCSSDMYDGMDVDQHLHRAFKAMFG
ncbi:PREDICTED: uncharacterized protein LOC106910865 isoform X2 [Scomber scombrus]